MKRVIIVSAILMGSMIFSKANAQVYVSARIEFPAPPIAVVFAAPRPVYHVPAPVCSQAAPVEYYSAPAPVGYYQRTVSTPYCQPAAPVYYRETRSYYPERYYKHKKHHKKW